MYIVTSSKHRSIKECDKRTMYFSLNLILLIQNKYFLLIKLSWFFVNIYTYNNNVKLYTYEYYSIWNKYGKIWCVEIII